MRQNRAFPKAGFNQRAGHHGRRSRPGFRAPVQQPRQILFILASRRLFSLVSASPDWPSCVEGVEGADDADAGFALLIGGMALS
jgi:hypothetical protein